MKVYRVVRAFYNASDGECDAYLFPDRFETQEAAEDFMLKEVERMKDSIREGFESGKEADYDIENNFAEYDYGNEVKINYGDVEYTALRIMEDEA